MHVVREAGASLDLRSLPFDSAQDEPRNEFEVTQVVYPAFTYAGSAFGPWPSSASRARKFLSASL